MMREYDQEMTKTVIVVASASSTAMWVWLPSAL